MASTDQQAVLATLDIPDSAAVNPDTTVSAGDVSQVVVAAGSVRNVDNIFITNRYTRFESLVFAITTGFASSSKSFKSDQDFAEQACALARAIAFQMTKYQGI